MNIRNKNDHILPLTSLRGLAATMIMLFHVRYVFRELQPFNFWIFDFKVFTKGYLWVDFFFLLSGYLLSMRYFTEESFSISEYRRFITQRIRRIFPVSIMMTILFVMATGLLKGWSGVTENFNSIIGNLSLIHAWGFYFAKEWNGPSWSLSAEWGAYVLFPILVTMVSFANSLIRKLILLAGLVGALEWISFSYHAQSLDMTTVHGLWKCILEVSLGICLAKINLKIASGKVNWDYLSLAVFTGLLTYLQFQGPDIGFVPLAAALIWTTSNSSMFWKSFLSQKPFIFLGKISFSVFMIHAFVCFVFESTYPRWLTHPLSISFGSTLFLALVAVVIALSYLSYNFVEEYFMGASKNQVLDEEISSKRAS